MRFTSEKAKSINVVCIV